MLRASRAFFCVLKAVPDVINRNNVPSFNSGTMPRQSRIDAPGALHHVLIRGIERKKIFKDDAQYSRFRRSSVSSWKGHTVILSSTGYVSVPG